MERIKKLELGARLHYAQSMTELLPMMILVLPLAVGGLIHGITMKMNLLSSLAVPMDGGHKYKGRRWFGDNKTYRGVVVMAFGTGIGFLILAIPALREIRMQLFPQATTLSLFFLGMAVGAAAMLSELPNSFLKRQLNVGSGKAAPGLLGWFFYALDQIDLLLGFWLVMAFAMTVTPERVLLSFALIFVGHQLVTVIGYALGMRKTFR